MNFPTCRPSWRYEHPTLPFFRMVNSRTLPSGLCPNRCLRKSNYCALIVTWRSLCLTTFEPTEYLLFRFALFKLMLLPYPWGAGCSRAFSSDWLRTGHSTPGGGRKPPKGVSGYAAQAEKETLKRVYLNLGLSAAELYLLPEKKYLRHQHKRQENLEAALALGKE